MLRQKTGRGLRVRGHHFYLDLRHPAVLAGTPQERGERDLAVVEKVETVLRAGAYPAARDGYVHVVHRPWPRGAIPHETAANRRSQVGKPRPW